LYYFVYILNLFKELFLIAIERRVHFRIVTAANPSFSIADAKVMLIFKPPKLSRKFFEVFFSGRFRHPAP
jgi:hypothetical protein